MRNFSFGRAELGHANTIFHPLQEREFRHNSIMSLPRLCSRIRFAAGPAFAYHAKRMASSHTTKVVERELPQMSSKSRVPYYIGGAIVGTAVWVVGLSSALNYQRLSSSVVSGTLFTVRYDPLVVALLGDNIDYADKWPWITGSVNHLQGKVNISFDVVGSKGERARVKFSSVRQGPAWRTIEFTVTRESDGQVVDIGQQELTEVGAPLVPLL
ncbi:cytochrome oxidase complex assembly protein 1-domain-containing protein [Radiomyces spectabilis]|uniref:cytochrome oxidase complex assembly protein 1-domain-containing protein n=1 Tax=Radiomyces spectabilis TaxID=64574 RepID=UPI00221E9CC3|nr:cytochrome oxidase complex assembly protein 1-domain-containing protein [Radiomyces spectabilis]KAI8393687.1 cytochrome oxidase complex assembly protein 1-domain-containing protein [Radiomyces spectabilis]